MMKAQHWVSTCTESLNGRVSLGLDYLGLNLSLACTNKHVKTPEAVFLVVCDPSMNEI